MPLFYEITDRSQPLPSPECLGTDQLTRLLPYLQRILVKTWYQRPDKSVMLDPQVLRDTLIDALEITEAPAKTHALLTFNNFSEVLIMDVAEKYLSERALATHRRQKFLQVIETLNRATRDAMAIQQHDGARVIATHPVFTFQASILPAEPFRPIFRQEPPSLLERFIYPRQDLYYNPRAYRHEIELEENAVFKDAMRVYQSELAYHRTKLAQYDAELAAYTFAYQTFSVQFTHFGEHHFESILEELERVYPAPSKASQVTERAQATPVTPDLTGPQAAAAPLSPHMTSTSPVGHRSTRTETPPPEGSMPGPTDTVATLIAQITTAPPALRAIGA